MTNNKRKYGNDKFNSGPLSDQPEINTGLLPGSKEVYVESNVDKSTKSSFLKDVPNWLKWLLLAALLLFVFWIWNNQSNDDLVSVVESTTTTSVIPTTTTITIPDPLDPDYFEPHSQRYKKYLDAMRDSSWRYSDGPRAGQKVVDDFGDKDLLALAHDVCDMRDLGYSPERIMDYLIGTNWGSMKNGTSSYDQFMPYLYHQALTYICR